MATSGSNSRAPAGKPLRIGVSSCLLGEAVRWDGGHKREAFLFDGLGIGVELVPVCPELELGLGVPREPIRLVDAGTGKAVRLVAETSGCDHSQAMHEFAAGRVGALAELSLSGYVLKQRSPSCGLRGVPVWPPRGEGAPRLGGRGVFAEALRSAFPELPMEEEHRLRDPARREAWMTQVLAYHRLHNGVPL